MGSDILESIVKKACSGKQFFFPKEIHEFALILQYYLPRAYGVNNTLENPFQIFYHIPEHKGDGTQ